MPKPHTSPEIKENVHCVRPGCDEHYASDTPGTLTLEAGGKRYETCSHACLMWLLAYDPEIGADRGAPLLGRIYPPTQHASAQIIYSIS